MCKYSAWLLYSSVPELFCYFFVVGFFFFFFFPDNIQTRQFHSERTALTFREENVLHLHVKTNFFITSDGGGVFQKGFQFFSFFTCATIQWLLTLTWFIDTNHRAEIFCLRHTLTTHLILCPCTWCIHSLALVGKLFWNGPWWQVVH